MTTEVEALREADHAVLVLRILLSISIQARIELHGRSYPFSQLSQYLNLD